MGKAWAVPLFADVPRQIVGVVGDVRELGIDQPAAPIAYLMQAQWIVRTAGPPLSMSEAIRRQILSVDSTIPVANFRSMEEIAGDSIAQYRFNMTLMSIFGGVALLLAVIGTYGVLSYQVGRRTREMGIRLALGAGRTKLLRLIIGQGLRLAALGIAIGLAATLALQPVLAALLYGVGPRDPVTYLGNVTAQSWWQPRFWRVTFLHAAPPE